MSIGLKNEWSKKWVSPPHGTTAWPQAMPDGRRILLSRDFPFEFMFWVNCGIGWSRRIEICSVLGLNSSFGAPKCHRHVICGYWGRHRRGSRRNSWP